MKPMSDARLIAELKAKYPAYTAGFGLGDFVATFGSPLEAAMYAGLFWPSFVVWEGMVFRKDMLEDEDDRERVRDALARYGGDLTETEKSCNLVEVPCGLFSRRAAESSASVDEILTGLLVEMWGQRLAQCFPMDIHCVEAVDPTENAGEWAVTFFRRRS